MNAGVDGDLYKVAMVGTLFGQLVVVTSHWKQSGANTSDKDSRTALAMALGNTLEEQMCPLLSSALTFNQAEVRDVVVPPDTVGGVDYADNPFPTAGTVTATVSCPPATAVVTRKRTAILGRKGRGRCYWPGVPIGSTSVGQLTSTPLADWTAAWAVYCSGQTYTGGGGNVTFNPVLIGLIKTGDPPVVTAIRQTPLVSADVDGILRQQRRREIAVGD